VNSFAARCAGDDRLHISACRINGTRTCSTPISGTFFQKEPYIFRYWSFGQGLCDRLIYAPQPSVENARICRRPGDPPASPGQATSVGCFLSAALMIYPADLSAMVSSHGTCPLTSAPACPCAGGKAGIRRMFGKQMEHSVRVGCGARREPPTAGRRRPGLRVPGRQPLQVSRRRCWQTGCWPPGRGHLRQAGVRRPGRRSGRVRGRLGPGSGRPRRARPGLPLLVLSGGPPG
jgi:hypothetical protein